MKTKEDKKEAKRIYDIEYRRKNAQKIKDRKAKYYQDNQKEIYRRQRIRLNNDECRAKHAEYCRRPDQRENERKNRYKRILGNDWNKKTKFCISCEEEKFILEFEHSPIFPDNRRHICNECESLQQYKYGYSTRLTLAAMKSRRYTNLQHKDFAEHPYLIEANKFLILLKRQLQWKM